MSGQNGESWSENPFESENNGSPLLWLAIAGVLLVVAVAVIIAIGNNRDESGTDSGDSESTIPTSTPAGGPGSPEDTPPIADPPDGSGSSEDTSPPDESSDEATTTAPPATSIFTATSTMSTATSADSP